MKWWTIGIAVGWRQRVAFGTLALLLLASINSLAAASITYNLVSYPDDQDQATLSGFIQTNGNTGFLSAADILSCTVNIVTSTGSLLNQTAVAVFSGLYATDTSLTLPSSLTAFFFVGNGEFEIDWVHGSGGLNLYRSYNLDKPSHPWQTWETSNPVMGGNDPWVIATAQIPEPATLIIWSLLGGLAIAVGWRRRRKALR